MKVFDYIIIGAGSAGCVLANRLSEDPNCHVLLIEEGPPDTSRFIHTPAYVLFLLRHPSFAYHYYTTPQVHMKNRCLNWPRGRSLGGSSSINGMIYMRGNPKDYDGWAALGNEGWSYKDVLPYFKKAENFEEGESPYHGIDGPLNVTKNHYISPLTDPFLKASELNGYAINPDFNGKEQDGFGTFHLTLKEGERCSTAKGYLTPIHDRPNLKVMTNARVLKILFDKKRAVCVQYLDEKKTREVHAKEEIILSAGTISSPHLLMLSGVGDKDMLESKGIKVVHHLPGVGKNLQDHLFVHLDYHNKTKEGVPGYLGFLKLLFEYSKYKLTKSGYLTTNYAESGGFVKTSPDLDRPDIQYHYFNGVGDPNARIPHLYLGYGASLAPGIVQPFSRGELTLKDGNHLSKPLMNPNYLSDPRDMESFVNGVKIGREIMMNSHAAKYFDVEMSPGPKVQSDEEIREFIRRKAETLYHPVGTCKMGVDDMSVVDPTLKVRGIRGLRVVDASIMPTIVGGNTNAPTIMIAEKAADMIKNRK
jgi:choline dehydrogenase